MNSAINEEHALRCVVGTSVAVGPTTVGGRVVATKPAPASLTPQISHLGDSHPEQIRSTLSRYPLSSAVMNTCCSALRFTPVAGTLVPNR